MPKNKRNYSQEIIERYSRLRNSQDRSDHLDDAITPIVDVLNFIEHLQEKRVRKIKKEIFKGAVIRMVACIEGYIRLAIKDIIEDKKYKDNVSKLKEVDKFDLITLLSLDKNEIKLSDLIANIIRINNFSDIESIFEILLGITLSKEIKKNLFFSSKMMN